MYRTVVDIDGMMCGMCESHVNDAVRNNFKVKKVSSSHSKGRTVIESEAPLDEAQLRKAIGATGYEVKGVTSEEMQKKACSAAYSVSKIGCVSAWALSERGRAFCPNTASAGASSVREACPPNRAWQRRHRARR